MNDVKRVMKFFYIQENADANPFYADVIARTIKWKDKPLRDI